LINHFKFAIPRIKNTLQTKILFLVSTKFVLKQTRRPWS